MASNSVYTGFWINWSRGPIYGATVTLSRADAITLIAFIAFFVGWVGTCFWRIICFILHYMSSHPGEADGLFHQQQAVLRNASEPESGLRLSILLYWAWRRKGKQAFKRLLFVFVASLSCIVVAVITSVFSSRVSEIGDEVLLVGNACAALGLFDTFPDKQAADIYEAYYIPKSVQDTSQIQSAANYVAQCYGSDSADGCDTFVKRRLPIEIDQNAACPFDESICKSRDKNLVIKTGLLDSHDDLGINSRPEDRFKFRRVFSCAPLVTEGHKSDTTDKYGNPAVGYNYQSNTSRNFTYVWPNETAYIRADYDVGVSAAFYAFGDQDMKNSDFVPINELSQNRTDADLFIFWLSANHVIFHNKTDDPWYLGNLASITRTTFSPTIIVNATAHPNDTFVEETVEYQTSEAASPLACRVQDQFCNPKKPGETGCSPLGGFEDPVTRAVEAFDEDYYGSLLRLTWFTWILGDMADWHQIVKTLGSSALTSRARTTNSGDQASIPDNQWMLDVQHWVEINLASFQAAAVITAQGPPPTPDKQAIFSRTPNNTIEREMCQSQKIRSKDFTSFSSLGLGLTFGLGLLIVIASYALDPIMTYLQKSRGIHVYKRLKWSTDGYLQLQRLGYEEAGHGVWFDADGDVPVTKTDELLPGLDLSDTRHPRISRRFEQEPSVSLLDKPSAYQD
ncbi:hypothetical protein QBC47DRAFT_407024 [Echria macrotheca]|uniref:Uncharacterized protein n=1 Tax=Echria macrotheca TaxID=438768 RepID=A0AAJ0B6R3_9PEZI|nr:hypothetical protein QBC47DRAFT_407024 [Echria macrotheca]